MAEYRDRTTGDLKTKDQLKAENPNMSFPKVWNDYTFDALNVDPVLASPAATTTAYQTSVRDGVEQDANGNWVEKYVARDMFADDPELGTKAEQEAAYQLTLDNRQAEYNRMERDRLIAETDWWASSDLTMTAEQTAYRQALRDITTHDNWPYLEDADWPTKP